MTIGAIQKLLRCFISCFDQIHYIFLIHVLIIFYPSAFDYIFFIAKIFGFIYREKFWSSTLTISHILLYSIVIISGICIVEGHLQRMYFIKNMCMWVSSVIFLFHIYLVIKWKNFPHYWPFVRGIHWSPVFPHKKVSDAELWCFIWSASE